MSYHPPYYKMFPRDYLSSPTTRGMTLAEHGVYKLLLDYAWLEEEPGTLPANLSILAKLTGIDRRILCKFTVKYPWILSKFPGDSQRIHNPRLRSEYEEFVQICAKNRLAGIESAKARQAKSTPVERTLNDSDTDTEVREEKKPRVAKTATPSDARFQPFFSYAYESYKAKHQRTPIWTGKDRTGLKNLLHSQSAAVLSLERLKTLWDNYSASTETFTSKQGDSLAYFCSCLGKFSDGPILEKPTGGTHGKQSASDLATRNARALGFVQ